MARLDKSITADALLLVGGGVVAAGLALLFAPHSGRKTRREIVSMGKSIGRRGDKAVRSFASNATDLAGKVGIRAGNILREGKELARDGKREILTAIEKGQETIGNEKRRLARMFA